VNFNLTKYANMQMCKYATNLTDVVVAPEHPSPWSPPPPSLFSTSP